VLADLHVLDLGLGGDVNVDVGVEVAQLREGGLGARDLADVLRADVEVAAEVGSGDDAGVVERDLLRSGEN